MPYPRLLWLRDCIEHNPFRQQRPRALCRRQTNWVSGSYYNRPEATADAIVDGWLHTGDTASIDEEGFIFLQGRKKEMIIVAGENVYPVEVENLLTRHPDVAEVAVIGAPHPVLGEVVRAVVVPQPGAKASERELRRYCTERLASYKVPQNFEFRDALPRNPSGKVVKRELSQG